MLSFFPVYVDDMLLAGNDLIKLEEVKAHFCEVFKIKLYGNPDTFLGIKIARNRQERNHTIESIRIHRQNTKEV